MISSRRLALVSLVAFALPLAAACGDPNSATSGTGAAVTTAAPAKPPVIHLANGGGTRNAAGGAATEAAPAAASTADSKMAIWAPTNFVYDGELPALDGSAASWYFAPGQQPDPERVKALAASLGVQGDIRQVPQDQGGGLAIGPEDYSGPVLTVGTDGLLSWWLSGTPASISASGCAVIEPATGGGVAGSSGTATAVAPPETVAPDAKDAPMPTEPACTPKPPVNVPTKDEALAKAKALFTSWGYDISNYQFDDTYADEWGASVNAYLMVDGMRAPINLSVGFGENGTINWASGVLATPQRGADYPTIGAAAGLDRLKEQQQQIMPLAAGAGAGVSTAADTPSGTAVAERGVAVAPVCEAAAATDCGPVNTEPITVTLNSVKRDLTMVWADDQTIWLLPAYTFGTADGGIYTVIAVDDAYVQQPATPDTTVPNDASAETTPAVTAVAEPAPTGTPAP